jgi:YebC/PmpR family DNA-binding regulatory protein
MSGHSNWSKIKRKKGATDTKRSNIFSRIIKEIHVAVKEGDSGDPSFNPRLRLAIANAKGANMPKDNVERAIKKALESGGEAMLMPTYEGYGLGGVAIFVECATDNLNRTVSHVRAAFNKYHGNLATNGSVDFMFDRKGVFVLSLEGLQMDEIELQLIDGGAEEIEIDTENQEVTITVDFTDFGNMQQKLEELNLEAVSANLERIPTTTTITAGEEAKKNLILIEALEEVEDVQNVYHNMELTEEVMEMMES